MNQQPLCISMLYQFANLEELQDRLRTILHRISSQGPFPGFRFESVTFLPYPQPITQSNPEGKGYIGGFFAPDQVDAKGGAL